MRAVARLYSFVLIGVFALALAIGMSGLARPAKISETENRKLAEAPAWPRSLGDLQAWPGKVEVWARDGFGMRRPLIRLYNRVSRKLAGRQASQRFAEGRDGWLFLNDEDTRRGVLGIAPPELLSGWRDEIGARRDWLARRGIEYLFVVAPDKQSIYPEHAPMPLGLAGTASRLDRIIASLDGDRAELLDLREALRRAKAEADLYYRYDTHWNRYGAYVAYRAIIERVEAMQVPVRPLAKARGEFLVQERPGGDLLRGEKARALVDADLVPGFALPCAPRALAESWDPLGAAPAGQAVTQRSECQSGAGRALILHDSFTGVMLDYLASSFAEVHFVWIQAPLPLLEAMVDLYRPDVVIEQRVERFLGETYRTDARARQAQNALRP